MIELRDDVIYELGRGWHGVMINGRYKKEKKKKGRDLEGLLITVHVEKMTRLKEFVACICMEKKIRVHMH